MEFYWQESEEKVCRFNSEAAVFYFLFFFVPATVLLLLHLPFVYFKVRKRGERMVGEKATVSPSLRVLLYSP